MNQYITTTPVVLEGFQRVFEPCPKFKTCTLKCIISDEQIIKAVNDDRSELLKFAKRQHKGKLPPREALEPWQEVAKGKFSFIFRWKPESPPAIVDSQGQPIEEPVLLTTGAQVNIVFRQKPYLFPGTANFGPDTVGTMVKLDAVQVVKLSSTTIEPPVDLSVFKKIEGGFTVSKSG